MRYTFFLILLVFLVTGTYFANAQMYEYRDEDGNMRFTDDLGNVPEDKRKNIKRIREIQRSSLPSVWQETPGQTEEKQEGAADQKETESDLIEMGEKLRREQAELQEEYDGIEAARTRLGETFPGEDASEEEFEAYRDKVNEINDRIQLYQERQKDHEERIKAYNAALMSN